MTYSALAQSRPAHRWTNGDLAAKVGADLGLVPDAEQQWLLDSIYAESHQGIPAAFEVAVVAPRQNLKSATLEVAALTDLFVIGVPLHVWTAHQASTATKAFQDMRARILRHPDYDERATFYEGHQDMAITTDTGERLEFHARSGKGGRGFSCDRLTLDEALYLRPGDMGALLPTMVTRRDAQVRYGSSAGLESSDVLRGIRDRGRAGKDRRLAYVEYGAERRDCAAKRSCTHEVGVEGCALDDRELRWQANCALWAGRITEEALETQRNGLPPAEFAREFLSWWEDPESVGGALPYQRWVELADADAARGSLVVFGADVAEDRAAWIATAWTRDDGAVQVMLTNGGQALPAAKLAEECARLTQAWGGSVVPPKAFEDEIDKAGSKVDAMGAGEFAAACGVVADRVADGTIRHGNQKALNEAVKAARWRSAGATGERAFQLKDSPEVGPLAAVARAVHGLTTAEPAGGWMVGL